MTTEYFEKMEIIIKNIMERQENVKITYDILDSDNSKLNKLLVLKYKQHQMKIGEIWQEMIGNYDNFINLKNGHETGLDILSTSRKVAIELNRTNTDNASSRKTNFDKLAKFKLKNPDYKCIYANINDNTEIKTLRGWYKKINYNGIEIEHQVGFEFLKFVFGENTKKIIEFIKNTLHKYSK